MKTKNIALTLYFISCIIAVIAGLLNDDSLLLFAKPIVIPAIYFYYLLAKKSKPSKWVALFFILNFAGDTILMLDFYALHYVLLPYFFAYSIMFAFAIAELRKLKFDAFNMLVGGFIFLFLTTMMIMVLQSFPVEKQSLIIPVSIYGLQLFAFAAMSGYIFFSTSSNKAFYLIIGALICVLSDFFYVLFTVLDLFSGFYFFDIGLQLFSYYFITKYFILRKN